MTPGNRPKVSVRPRTEPCIVRTTIDDDIYVACTFTYIERQTAPANLSERLSAEQGNDWARYRVLAGDADVMVSRYQSESDFRIDGLDAYTNPNRWPRRSLPEPVRNAEDVFLLFDVPYETDENVYRVFGESEFVWDAPGRRLRLRFGEESSASHWLRIGDTAYALLSEDDRLLALQFEAVSGTPGTHAR